ncbi:MAG: hypothetical protein U0K68_11730 [Agathobacter sp.]|nr:hypothetical protein [Agathobacter sp.]
MAEPNELEELENDNNKSKKEERKEKKEKKKKEKEKDKEKDKLEDEEQEETTGGKLVMVVVTILIILIWLGIIGILIKADVGGFGSSVLYPMLKDVPYVNKILPTPNYSVGENTESAYNSLEDAVERIKELEKQLDELHENGSSDAKLIEDLQKQIESLSKYKEEQAAFEKLKEKFYEEVVFSDKAPDINEYKTYYESIDPENAEVLYKQVVEQQQEDKEIEDYVATYSSMKPAEAASIFNTMKDNLKLVAKILKAMDSKSRANIMGKMDAEIAAKVTEIMNPK